MSPAASAATFQSEGPRVARFGERMIIQTKGRWAGEPLAWVPWQRQVLNELHRLDPETGRRVYSEGMIGIARKNGKSTFASTISLYGLFREQGGEIYNAAGSKEQARTVFAQSKAYVEANPHLLKILRPYKDVIECPATGSIYRVLSADGDDAHGKNPSDVIIDETHVLTTPKQRELIDALSTAGGARLNPLVLHITTAGYDKNTECYRLYKLGMELLAKGGVQALRDAGFFFRWFQATDGCAVDDKAMWKMANPSPWVEDRYLEQQLLKRPEQVFRRLHLNQWTESDLGWLPVGAWAKCGRRGIKIPEGSDVFCGIDIGPKKDRTAFVIVGRDPDTGKAIAKAKIFASPKKGETFDFALLDKEIYAAGKTYRIKSIAYDPWAWIDGAQRLERKGFPMVEWPMTNARMSPASGQMYQDIINQEILYDLDDPDAELFADHVNAGVVSENERGFRVSKDKAKSPIDALISLILAKAEQQLTPQPVKRGIRRL